MAVRSVGASADGESSGRLSLQERIVGREVRGRPLGQGLLLARSQGQVERVGHLVGDVGLHREDVRDLGVERLLPLHLGRAARPTSTSSGLTFTRLVPSAALAQRIRAMSR